MATPRTPQRSVILAGFAFGILTMAIVGIFAAQSSARFAASAERISASHRTLTTLEEMMRVISRMESESRGYVITGQDAYLAHYAQTPDTVRRQIETLRQLRGGTQTSQIDRITELAHRRMDNIQKVVSARASEGQEAAVKIIRTGQGKRLMDDLRWEVGKLEKAERQTQRVLEAENQTNRQRAMLFIPFGIVVSLLAVAVAAVMVVRDSERRIQAEAELKRSLAYQATLVDCANVCVISTDLKGAITSINRTGEEWLRYRAEELVGKATVDRLHVSEELEARSRALGVQPGPSSFVERTIKSGSFEEEWTYVRKDGSQFPVLLSVSRLEGDPAGLVFIASDLTERVEAERKLDRHVRELEAAREDLAEKNRLLEKAAEELEESRDSAVQAMNTKSEFLANMSHEIRTPLNGVLGTTHLLLNTPLNEKQEAYVDLIRRSAESLLGILNDVLDLSKMEAGKMTLEAIPFDLREVAEDVCEQFAPIAHQKDLDLNLLIPTSLPARLIGDPGRLRQVLTNLVANAIKFTESGEVDVIGDVVREDAENITLRLSVKDTGIGIPAEKLQAIFDSFTQADGATARRYGGTGLGLAISRQLIELMNGQIGVESVAGEGSEFYFTLNFKKDPTESEAPRDLGGISVLIADDNETNRLVLKGLLRAWNCDVVEAESGNEALSELTSKRFDCGLLDMHMPGASGMDVAREVRRKRRVKDTPLILISSSHAMPSESEIAGLFHTVLAKPVRSRTLFEAVSDAVRLGVGSTPATAATSQASLAGLRVLVVEDNPINQLVVTELLRSWSCDVVAVDNGRKAVDRLTVDVFDAVLMDVQMPEMDGLEATRTIRKREATTGRHIPIIAMTANAMRGDEEKCLNAGMDVYLSKPIQPRLLAETLAGVAGRTIEAVPTVEEQPSESLPVFDPDQLEQSTSGKIELQTQVLERYLETLGPQSARLEDAVRLGDRHQIRSVAHALKGSSWTVGAVALADVYRQMEQGADALSLDTLGSLLSRTEGAVAAVRERIEGHLARLTRTGP